MLTLRPARSAPPWDRPRRLAGREVEAAYVSVPSGSVRTSRSTGVLSVSSSEVTQAHVKRVQEVGRAVPIPPGHELIHALSQQYSVDGRDGIRDPLGMSATRLEADICIVTADMAICRDLSRVIDRAGYRPDELVMAPLATALAVLDDSEREEGVAHRRDRRRDHRRPRIRGTPHPPRRDAALGGRDRDEGHCPRPGASRGRGGAAQAAVWDRRGGMRSIPGNCWTCRALATGARAGCRASCWRTLSNSDWTRFWGLSTTS